MSRKWNNIFFGFGLAALILMAAGIDMDEARDALKSASYRFPLIVMLWALLYILNTAAWYLIINAGGRSGIKFGWLYKVTVSGFALNYATPGGLMGGEPYRVMELKPHIGVERVVGHTVCDDAHLQPSVVLAHVGAHMSADTACRRAHGIGDGCHDGVLRARTVVLHIMLPHRSGIKTDKPHTPHADAEKENGSLRRAQP